MAKSWLAECSAPLLLHTASCCHRALEGAHTGGVLTPTVRSSAFLTTLCKTKHHSLYIAEKHETNQWSVGTAYSWQSHGSALLWILIEAALTLSPCLEVVGAMIVMLGSPKDLKCHARHCLQTNPAYL
jgi:hypothetical protein